MKIDATTYRQRQVLLVVVGVVVFSEPFLGIVRSEAMVFGVPSTMVTLFGLWLAVIVGIAWIMRRDPSSGTPPTLGMQPTVDSEAPENQSSGKVSSKRFR